MVTSDDFEITLHLPIGDGILPLPPLPFARRGEVVDEIVAEPVACQLRSLEVTCRLDQRARGARHVRTAAGLTHRDLTPEEQAKVLIEEFGYSPEIVARLLGMDVLGRPIDEMGPIGAEATMSIVQFRSERPRRHRRG